MMRIVGVDPGYQRVGWAVIDTGVKPNQALAYGCLETEKHVSAEIRLLTIHQELNRLVKKFQPDAMAVEELYFATNAKTAIGVGQARGVILLTAAENKVPVISYTPLAVKQTICGSGTADKLQIQKMIILLLNLKEVPRPDDAADALAIALTHAYSYKMLNIIKLR